MEMVLLSQHPFLDDLISLHVTEFEQSANHKSSGKAPCQCKGNGVLNVVGRYRVMLTKIITRP